MTATTPGIVAPKPLPIPKFLRSPRTARILFPIVVIAVWYLVYFTLGSRIFVPPHRVAQFMWDEVTLSSTIRYGSVRTNLYGMLGLSVTRLFVGFAIAVVAGTVIGLAMGVSKSVDAFFHDWVMAILAMPALVWGLFLGLVFGFGSSAPILTVILAGIPFVIVNVKEGVRNTPKDLFDMARAFEVPSRQITRHVLLPSLMPFFFAAVRYAFSIGWKGLVIAEVFGSDAGMGWTIKFWYDAHRTQGVIGYALFIVIVTLGFERLVLEPISRRVFRWRPRLGATGVIEEAFAFDEDAIELGDTKLGDKSAL